MQYKLLISYQFCGLISLLTLNAPIETMVVCFSRLLKSLSNLHGKQLLNLSVMLRYFCS